MNPQTQNYTDCDLIGFVKYLFVKSFGYNSNVYCTSISGMGRTQKLPDDVERIGMEKNLRRRGEDP